MAHNFLTAKVWLAALPLALTLLAGCQSQPAHPASAAEKSQWIKADDLFIVDCLLPGQVRQLGSNFTYVAPRRAIRTSANDCALRGGEYVAYDRASYQTALKIWLPAAEKGDPEAQNHVGEIYEKGLGAQPDYQKAAEWYARAAAQNYARAQINLGHLYEQGLGVEHNPVKALELYRQASGITDGKLELTSEEEQRLREQMALENEKLRQQVQQLTDQLNITQEILQQREKSLKEQQRKLRQLQQQMQNGQLDDAQKQQQARQMQRLRQLIARQEQEIARYKASANRLLQQLGGERRQLAGNQPNIDILAPELIKTRGAPMAVVLSSSSGYEVVGKVDQPDRLASFRINDQDALQLLKANGLFQYPVTILDDNTPVKIEAITQDGRKTSKTFVISKQPEQKVQPRKASQLFLKRLSSDLGRYHALVIGNNDYLYENDLKTAANDARAVADVLKNHYGYEVQLLIDANRDQMVKALADLQKNLGPDDNLLIYYAGHGVLNDNGQKGYWLPVDARPNQPETWVANDQITDFLAAMKARHVLVMADSCYSGALSGAAIRPLPEEASDQDLLFISRVRARTVLTSGGLEPVADNSGGQHSLFAKALLAALEENNGLMEGYRIYKNVREIMARDPLAATLRQVPEYTALSHAGHEGSEYFFLAGL